MFATLDVVGVVVAVVVEVVGVELTLRVYWKARWAPISLADSYN